MKTLLITGASKGLGYHCAEYFDNEDYDVIALKGTFDFNFNYESEMQRLESFLNQYKIDKVIHCAGGGFGLRCWERAGD